MEGTKDAIRDIINNSRVVEFRQSLNLFSKNWGLVKIQDPKTKQWIPFDRKCMERIITKKHGYGMAIYALGRRFKKIVDVYDRPEWKVTDVAKGRKAVGKNTYSVFRLTVTRQKHDISGVF